MDLLQQGLSCKNGRDNCRSKADFKLKFRIKINIAETQDCRDFQGEGNRSGLKRRMKSSGKDTQGGCPLAGVGCQLVTRLDRPATM